MAEIQLKIEGLDQLQRRLNELAQGLGAEVGNALRAEAEIEMTEAKRRTPVLTGVLKGSGHVTGPRFRGRNITVELKFGGPAAPYAVAVHENLEAFHKNGEAKFLERPLMESAPHLAARVARRIKLR
jgi:hypothetical protein